MLTCFSLLEPLLALPLSPLSSLLPPQAVRASRAAPERAVARAMVPVRIKELPGMCVYFSVRQAASPVGLADQCGEPNRRSSARSHGRQHREGVVPCPSPPRYLDERRVTQPQPTV